MDHTCLSVGLLEGRKDYNRLNFIVVGKGRMIIVPLILLFPLMFVPPIYSLSTLMFF
jgi:hypothetical protein